MTTEHSPAVRQRLWDAGIRHYDELIHDQSREWLIANFRRGRRKYPVNVTALMRNIIWQLRGRIQRGEKPPYNELVRTCWYMYVKPTLARAGALAEDRDQYPDLVEQLVHLVKDIQVMRYRDIGFADDNPADRIIGAYPNIILVAEKEGHAAFVREMCQEHRISGIALRGQPSLISVEYFVDQLRDTGVNTRRTFYLFTLVDYDPSGWIIRDVFIEDLNLYGIRNVKAVDLITPDMLTPEEILNSRYPVPAQKNMHVKNQKWLRLVRKRHYAHQQYLQEGKRLYGLEAQAVSTIRLRARLAELIKPVYGLSEARIKEYELKQMIETLLELMSLKFKTGAPHAG